MGVMACNRAGCKNIMCDHYSEYYGCICGDCLRELYERGESSYRSHLLGGSDAGRIAVHHLQQTCRALEARNGMAEGRGDALRRLQQEAPRK